MPNKLASFVALATLAIAPTALAQTTLPKGTAKDESVSKGKTDVTKEGFEAAAQKDEKAKDARELSLNAGGLAATGNSKSYSATAGASYRLRRGDNMFSFVGAGNYSRAAIGGAPMTTTVENLQGRARYDRFFAADWTVFLGVQGRRDRFAGLDLRLQVDPGFGYYFVNEKDSVLWGELGYDLLYDVRRNDARIPKDKDGNPIPGAALIDKTNAVHSGRAFVGLKHKFNENVGISAGLEFLQGLSATDTRRVNGDLVFNSKISTTFSLATAFLFRYDNKPLPGKRELDTITSINLVYTLL